MSRRRSALGAGGLVLALVLGGAIANTAAHAASPVVGAYQGTSTLLYAGDNEVDWDDTRPISFEVDADGSLTGLTGGYFWTCISGGEPGTTSYLEDSPFPATTVEVDSPFSVVWSSDGGAIDYTFEGTINSNGAAEGLLMADIGICGSSVLSWSAHNENGTIPAPVEVTAEAPTRDENTVTIPVVEGVTYVDADGAELSGAVMISEGGVLTVVATADEGYVLAEGTHDWVFEYEDITVPAPVEVTAEAPTRDENTVTIPVVEGVTYVDADGAELSGAVTISEGGTLTVVATADEGYVLSEGTHEWVFEAPWF